MLAFDLIMRIKLSLVQAHLLLFALSLFVIASCGRSLMHRDSEPEKASGPAAAVQTTSHRGVGVVKSLNEQKPSIEIDHGEIKGLMPAMQMAFLVKDQSLLNGLAVGDKIEFTVESGVNGLRIVAISKIQS